MSSTSMTEKPGFIRESQTAYGKLWNIDDEYTMYQPFYTNGQPEAIKITQEMIDLIHTGQFDGCTTAGNIIWSWGPCDKFDQWLKDNGHWTVKTEHAKEIQQH
jgi:hypothetical protein